ncbi:MAG: trigger factor, partial [Mycoplasma sp.]|nr:trigger factor [Mycoplasma sp.]
TDKEIEFEIKNAIKNDYMLSAKEDGVIAKGDMAKFDFEGFICDKAIDGGAAKDYELEIGSGLFIPGFEDQMIGLKKGEKKTIEVTFPKNYPVEEYRNKKAKFNLLIKEISKITYPTLDKVYLAKFNLPNVENEKQFREYIKKEIKKAKGVTKRQELIKIIHDWVVKNIKIDYIPDYFIKSETNAIKQDYELQAKNKFNKKLEDAVVDLGFKSMDDFNKQIHDKVVNNIKFSLGMDKLITALAINVTKEEIEKEITDTARKINMNVNELLNNQNILNSIKQYMLNDKIVQKLLEVNKKQTKNIEKK